MARQPTALDDSWIVNDTDEADISWAEESDRESTELLETRTPAQKQRHKKPQQTHRHIDQYIASSHSDFIMPSLDPSPMKARRTAQDSPRIPQKSSRTVAPSAAFNVKGARAVRKVQSSSVDDGPSYIAQMAEYVLDIIFSALKKLKQPISWALAAYLFAGGIVLIQNFLTSSIYNALSPICRVPGVSFLHLPICNYHSPSDHPTIQPSSQAQSEPEFDALMNVQSQFDSLLSSSSQALSLPLDMKRSETSIRDLRQVVRFSNIPSKHELVHEFDGFIETARIASYDLQKFNSHVGRAVDNVLATAKWTQRVLDDIEHEKSQRGVLPAFISDRLLSPFQPLRFTEARLLDQYITHTSLISDEIANLIDRATTLLLILSNLEDRLELIHSISLHDNMATSTSRDEVLSNLWTILGGNRDKLGKLNNQLTLLNRVGEYRKLAYAHVSATVIKLQGMSAELEELRSRVGTAEVLRDTGVKGVPLSVHLEAIRLGVERLEGQREQNREVERGYARRVIDAGDSKDDRDERRVLVEA